MMGEIYDVRSAVEHLHEYKYLEEFNREIRLDLIQKEAIVEWIARSALARVIAQEALWKHFANTPALSEFWDLPRDIRQQIWGASVDIQAPLSGFRAAIHQQWRAGRARKLAGATPRGVGY